ncbi:polysaccharide deacetylase family protein [Sulfitobacter sp. HNIBRBA3233]|uniref:polysaccharide deacetylase family protein n=1 Tax=Sulfitobacter marinivivus TaxID=3158558 RepID=UPI0032DF5582
MTEWGPLRQETRIWQSEGLRLPLWWRDDDAVSASAPLERLVGLSEEVALPVYLAVIPDLAEPSLVDAVAASGGALRPVVHGWRHENHAPAGSKKAEFGQPRATARDEICEGYARLSHLFGPALNAMFVPPWNRIDDSHLPGLVAAGHRVISVFGPRKRGQAVDGLRYVNTHLDPVDWRGTRSLVPAETLIAGLVADLRARRAGHVDGNEPYGLLTHHLVHDAPVWDFTRACLTELLSSVADPADPMAVP